MLYRNVKTGALIDIKSDIMSDIWEPVEKQAPVVIPTAEAVEKEQVAPVQQKKTTRKKKAEE